MSPPVTVAIVSWNTRSPLERCLRSLQSDADQGLADVWVVDNASVDGSADLVRTRFDWVHLIASETNLGFGAAVNMVATRSSSRWLAPANADVQVTPGALAKMLSEGERRPEAAMIAPRLVLPNGTTQQSVYPFPTVPFTLAYVLGLTDRSHQLAEYWCIDGGFDPEVSREVCWAVGAFGLVRRAAFDQVGGFAPDQWMYAEDLDLGWRLRKAGWRTRYAASAVVLHEESVATRKAWGEDRHRRWHVASYAWLVRRRGPAVAQTVAAINVVGHLCRAVLHWPGARAGRERDAAARRVALATARSHAVGLRTGSVIRRARSLASPGMSRSAPEIDPAEIQRKIAANHDWYHTIELAPGIVTPGWVDTRSAVEQVPIPPTLAGLRCLDVGTWDGFWAFEMERRGASEVHALDVPDPYRWDWPRRARILESYEGGKENLDATLRNGNGFPIAREVIGSNVKRHELAIYEATPERLGTFDFVFMGSLLLHLRDPVGALERLHAIVDGEIVFNECIEYVLTRLMPRTPMARLDAEDRVWWWQPNLAAVRSMIEQAGFEIMDVSQPYFVPFGPRYQRPVLGARGVLTRLRTPKGWEEIVLYTRGIAHVAVRAKPLRRHALSAEFPGR